MFANCFLFAALLASPPPQAPIDQLKTWDDFSSMSASTMTADGRFGYVAAGSSVTILHLAASPPCKIGTIKMNAQAREIIASDGRVFVAGGTAGLIEITQPAVLQCGTSLVGQAALTRDDNANPVGVPGGGTVGAGDNDLECLALGILKNHPVETDPLLLAIFSGRTLANLPQTELRFYKLPTGAAPEHLKTYMVPVPDVNSLTLDLEIAAANTSDGKRFVYLANDIGGVMRLNVADLMNIGYRQGPKFDQPGQLDLNCVAARATHLSLADDALFVAIDRAGLAEISVANAAAWSPSQSYWSAPLTYGTGSRLHAYRVSAVKDTAGNFVIAVGTNSGMVSPVTGYFFDLADTWDCPTGPPPTPCNPTAAGSCEHNRMHVLTQLVGQTNPSEVATLDVEENWTALKLRKKTSPSGTADYEVSGAFKLHFNRWDVVTPLTAASITCPSNYEYFEAGTGPLDAFVSSVNSDLVVHCSEVNLPIGLMQIINSDTDIVEAPNTRASPAQQACDATCSTACAPPCMLGCCAPCRASGVPYTGCIFDGEHWVDTGDLITPPDPTREWFVLGGSGNIRGQCPTNPCLFSRDYHAAAWKLAKSAGWTMTTLRPNFLPTSNDALDTNWGLLWWQVPGPSSPFIPGFPGGRYWSAHLDKGAASTEDVLYMLRWLVPDGVTVVSRSELIGAALAQCPTTVGSTSATGGSGQFLDLDQLLAGGQLTWMHKPIVHFEHEKIAGADPYLPPSLSGYSCLGPGTSRPQPGIRMCATARATNFSLTVGSASKNILAVAAGHANNPIHPDVNWRNRLNKPMVVFYDVTGVGPSIAPTPVRLLFGPDFGDALNVDIAYLGTPAKPYAFVGDLAGRVLVYDLSNLLSGTFGPAPGQALDTPVATWRSNQNRWDLHYHNVADVELEVVNSDSVRAYVANGQAGLTVVTFSGFNGGSISSSSYSKDTPVFADGLAFRPASGTPSTIVLSDTTGSGLKVFKRP